MSSFLSWQSPIKLETVFAKSSISYPSIYKGKTYWLELLPQEQGRVVLMQQDEPGKQQCITPDDVSLRTKVNEYGGNCYLIADDQQFFINALDQSIYSQPLDLATPEKRISPQQNNHSINMYADMQFIEETQLLIAVCEQTVAGKENKTTIVAIDTQQGTQTTLLEGADFYSSLCLSVDNKQLAWIQWDHPNMPWNDTELSTADIQLESDRASIQLLNKKAILAEKGACVCQPLFAMDGSLFFSVDYANASTTWQSYWNLHCYRHGKITNISNGKQEFGSAHWVFGNNRLANIDQQHILGVCSEQGEDKLLLINTKTLEQQTLVCDMALIEHMATSITDKKAVLLCATPKQGSELKSWSDNQPTNQLTTVIAANKVLDDKDISIGQHISYPTTDNDTAYAYFYAPKNQSGKIKQGELPPLLVMVHGGPTSRANNALDIQKQFWTSNGFAVLDINHRGSTGYGRQYRDALINRWGEVDAQDIVKGVEYVAQHGWVNGQQVCIRGKSAGGYAVLRALTEFPDTFKAGACYYGIGNLVTLAETTHKFEKYYTDSLLGEKFINAEKINENSLYYQRSPINFMHQIKSAMIIFQGLEDKVVPPALSQEVVKTLKKLDISYEYVEYPEEGHGFRKLETNVDALNKELNFFRRILQS